MDGNKRRLILRAQARTPNGENYCFDSVWKTISQSIGALSVRLRGACFRTSDDLMSSPQLAA